MIILNTVTAKQFDSLVKNAVRQTMTLRKAIQIQFMEGTSFKKDVGVTFKGEIIVIMNINWHSVHHKTPCNLLGFENSPEMFFLLSKHDFVKMVPKIRRSSSRNHLKITTSVSKKLWLPNESRSLLVCLTKSVVCRFWKSWGSSSTYYLEDHFGGKLKWMRSFDRGREGWPSESSYLCSLNGQSGIAYLKVISAHEYNSVGSLLSRPFLHILNRILIHSYCFFR